MRAISGKLANDCIGYIDKKDLKLYAMVCSHIYLSELLQPWFTFVYMESKSLSRKQKEKAKENELLYEESLSNVIQEGIDAEVFVPVDTQLTAAALMAMLQDWHLKRWKYRDKGVSPNDFSVFMLQMVRRMLGVKTG